MAGVEVIDLDDPSTAEAVSADPALVAGSAAPVCIDEYQHAPELLGAIKSELNRGLRPGRFVLTGSTRSEAVPELARYLAGRVHLLSVLPFFPGRARWNPGGSAGGASPWRFHQADNAIRIHHDMGAVHRPRRAGRVSACIGQRDRCRSSPVVRRLCDYGSRARCGSFGPASPAQATSLLIAPPRLSDRTAAQYLGHRGGCWFEPRHGHRLPGNPRVGLFGPRATGVGYDPAAAFGGSAKGAPGRFRPRCRALGPNRRPACPG